MPPDSPMEPRLSHLESLLGDCFASGWMREASDVDDVLSVMIDREGNARFRAALEELDELLGRGLCEPQLRDVVLYELGCEIAPERNGRDVSAWLRHVQRAWSQAVIGT